MDGHYNPYEDPALQLTKPKQPEEPIETKQGFNDVMQHFDIVNGVPMPKKTEDLPKRWRKILRWVIIVWLIWVGYSILSNLISIFFS